MPKIPSATRIPTQQFSGQQGVVQMQVVDNGMASFGDSVAGVGRDLDTVDKAERQYTLDGADTTASIAGSQLREKFENDPDYGTAEERGLKAFDESLNEIASGIGNEKDRARWLEAQGRDREVFRGRLTNNFRIKDKDASRADINDQTADLRKAALTEENPGEMRVKYDRLLESSVARGYITAQEQEKMSTEFQGRITADRLIRMPADQLTDALKDPDITKYLDPDEMYKLEQKAEVETVYNSAVTVVDTAMGVEGATPESVGAAVDAITDPKVRRQAETIYRSELAAKKTADTAEATAAYTHLDTLARENKWGVEDLRMNPEFQKLSVSQKHSIEATAKADLTGTKRTVNNGAVHAEASRLAERKEWRQLDNLLNGYGDQLTGSTRDKYRNAASDGKAPGDVKYGPMVDVAIGAGSSTLDKRNSVKVKMADWHDQFAESMQRDPTRAEAQAEIDVYTKEIVNNWYTPNVDPTYGATDDASMQQHATLREAEMREDNQPAYLRAVAALGDGVNQFDLRREFDNQKTLEGYRSMTNPESAKLWADVDAKVKKKFGASGVTIPSSVMIQAYEAERNARAFQ